MTSRLYKTPYGILLLLLFFLSFRSLFIDNPIIQVCMHAFCCAYALIDWIANRLGAKIGNLHAKNFSLFCKQLIQDTFCARYALCNKNIWIFMLKWPLDFTRVILKKLEWLWLGFWKAATFYSSYTQWAALSITYFPPNYMIKSKAKLHKSLNAYIITKHQQPKKSYYYQSTGPLLISL